MVQEVWNEPEGVRRKERRRKMIVLTRESFFNNDMHMSVGDVISIHKFAGRSINDYEVLDAVISACAGREFRSVDEMGFHVRLETSNIIRNGG